MEKDAAQQLFLEFLAVRGVAASTKKLLCLLVWAKKAGLFKLSSQLFDVLEWQEVGDKLREKAIDGGKEAKELGPTWREVMSHLKQYQAEKKVAMAAQHMLDDNEDRHGQSGLFKTVPVAPGVEVPVLQNAGEVQEAAAAAEASNSATSAADAGDSGCRPKTLRSTPLPPSSSSDSDSDGDINRKRRDRGSQIPSAPRYRPLPWAPPPPPPAGITDNLRALDFGNDDLNGFRQSGPRQPPNNKIKTHQMTTISVATISPFEINLLDSANCLGLLRSYKLSPVITIELCMFGSSAVMSEVSLTLLPTQDIWFVFANVTRQQETCIS
ncbi:uncharacterized protein [Pithys albifrons albifrons]|uniref:uncharacterized protein n=1 Tax=Pithys albifrons albifrons TaxID=3385563 RepID=UPI003A5D022B